MQGKRLDRMNSLIKEELGVLITTKLRDSRIGFVTVLDAQVTPDLKYCKVYISVLGSEKEVKATLAALNHSEGFLKREVSKALDLQFIPELHFKLDKNIDETLKIENIFRKIQKEDEEKKNNRVQSIELLAGEIEKYDSFLISGHIQPEGDCAGSILSMERLLKALGKKTQIYCESPYPKTLNFLEHYTWKRVDEFTTPPQADATVTVDTPNWERLGTAAELIKSKPVINIDHHVSNQDFGSFNFVDDAAAACGEIIFALFEHFKIPVDLEAAKTLYTSISTDTGSFRYSNTSPKTHRTIGALIEAGLNVEKINQEIYGEFEEARLELLQLVLKNRQFAFDRQISFSMLPHEDLVKTGGTPEDMEGLIDFLRGIRGVRACFLMTEWTKGVVKVSFRSSTEVDVNQVASQIQGGGHRKAAGATLRGTTLEEAKNRILEIFKTILTTQDLSSKSQVEDSSLKS